MSFNINLKEFKNLLQKVYSIVPSRTPYNVLLNLKFVVENRQLKVYATDIDTSIVAKIDIDSNENIKFAVNAKKIYDWITIYNGDENQNIAIDVNNSNMTIVRGKSKSNFACVDVNDYPEFTTFEKNKSYDFPIDKLKYISSRVANFTAAKDPSRNRGALEGVLFDCSKNKFISVATDANKLSIVSFNSILGFDGNVSVIIPPRPLNEVAKIAESFDYENIKFSFYENSVSFFADDFELITKLLEGPYPDYERVIPKEFKLSFSIYRQELINSLKIVATVASKENNLTILCLKNNELSLHSEDISTNSKGDEFLEVDYPFQEDFVIGFNSAFLIEILSAIDTQKVKFEFVGNTAGAVIKPIYSENEDEKNILFLLMPLRIN